MDNKLILIGALIIVVIIVIIIVILNSKKSETFVEPRGFGGKMLKTNMLSNAYSGGQKYDPTSVDPAKLRSSVSKAAMANAGSIDVLSQYFSSMKSQNPETTEEPAAETSSDSLILTQNNTMVPTATEEPEIPAEESELVDPESGKEGFFSTGLESAKVNAMGVIEGPKLYANNMLAHGLTYDEIVKGVNEGKHVSDHCTAGVGKGDAFEGIWSDYTKIQDQHDMSPTGVRSQEEMDEIHKSLNGNMNMASHNLLTRAGSGRTKIKLDPNGTVGVMEDNARLLPERDRNHTIYATNHVIHMPGYETPYEDKYQAITNGGSGFGKAMAAEVSDVVTGIGRNSAANSKILNDKTNESFSTSF